MTAALPFKEALTRNASLTLYILPGFFRTQLAFRSIGSPVRVGQVLSTGASGARSLTRLPVDARLPQLLMLRQDGAISPVTSGSRITI